MNASAFLRKQVPLLLDAGVKRVLDAPSGTGRNALYLQELGMDVVCVDKNEQALEECLAAAGRSDGCGVIETVLMDFDRDTWAFADGSFDAVLNVHYVDVELLTRLTRALRHGGILLFETFENRGENYLELPKTGEMKLALQDGFELLVYEEKDAGPRGCNAVTVRLLGRRM